MVIQHRARAKGEFEDEKGRGRLQVFGDRLHKISRYVKIYAFKFLEV